jgi:hypothetical protein
MIDDGDKRWFVRHADLIYKLILVALVGMWIAFPPHASQPSAARSQRTVMIERSQ